MVFADWLFFGLTAGALLIVRAEDRSRVAGESRTRRDIPCTTVVFVLVAVGIVVNSFVAYPTQSLIGSAILRGRDCGILSRCFARRPA